MKQNLKCIMLIDDNKDDNFIHTREIKKNNSECSVISESEGVVALEYLELMKKPHPDLIFLDINMPGMNGWEFLTAYSKLGKEYKSHAIIIMLTTSENPDEMNKAKAFTYVSDFIIKPLTREKMKEITAKYFNDYILQ